MNEGIRRLAILLGILCESAWLMTLALLTEGFTRINNAPEVWAVFIGISVLSFFVPFGLVHGVAWVMRGFRQSSEKPPVRGKSDLPQ